MIRVLHMLPDLELGGGQLLLLRNISAMDPAEFSHAACTIRAHGTMHDQFRAAGVDLHTLDLRTLAGMPAALRRLVRLVHRLDVDIIHTNNTGSDRLFGQSAALLTGKPVVNSLHSPLQFGRRQRGPGKILQFVRLRIDRAVARRTIRHVVAVGQSVRQEWHAYFRALGVDDHRHTIVHPGLELAPYEPRPDHERAALRQSLGLADASPLLITVARMTSGKGQNLMFPLMRHVLARYPCARLLLVGDGPLRPAHEHAARREGVGHAVVFAGARLDVPALLDAADLAVFPSLGEGLPLAVLEAMAAGKPVVAFDLPSFMELHDDPPCAVFVAPIGDGPALTRAVLDVLAQPDRMAAMAATARRIVETRFTQQAASRALERIYREVLKSPPRNQPDARRAQPAGAG